MSTEQRAARSGKQNIVEGNSAATTSLETELKLLNVARASLQELLVDYEDYLRVNHLEQWKINSPPKLFKPEKHVANIMTPPITEML